MTLPQAWTPPPFPPAEPLEGRYCRLEPIDVDRHLDDLWEAIGGQDHIWAWMPAHPPADRQAYRALIAGMAEKPGIVPYAVIDRADGRAKGHLWLMEIRPEHGVFEVGYITYSPRLQRTRVASEAIRLCGAYGFSLGYRRFEWKCNDLNEPSKRAARRFGFQYEGLFRQHMVVKGCNRDTAWFSILDHEWPVRERAFARWLDPANFDGQGRQKQPLSLLNAPVAESEDLRLRRASLADTGTITALTTQAALPDEAIVGVPALPRLADYAGLIAEDEVWVLDGVGDLDAVLVLRHGAGDFVLWSLAVAPAASGRGIGGKLVRFAEARARALGFPTVRLYTHAGLSERIAWYGRLGYAVTHQEELSDRRLTHLAKPTAVSAK